MDKTLAKMTKKKKILEEVKEDLNRDRDTL